MARMLLLRSLATMLMVSHKALDMIVEVFEKAITDMVREICLIQAAGDYEASKAFIDKYAVMAPELAAGLKKLEGIPVDLEPLFPRYE